MTKIINASFYKDNPDLYNALSDFVWENNYVPLLNAQPEVLMEVELEDCVLDNEGNFFMPYGYGWSYTGTNDTDDRNEYIPLFSLKPTLTKLEVQNLLAQYQEQDINNPANNAN